MLKLIQKLIFGKDKGLHQKIQSSFYDIIVS